MESSEQEQFENGLAEVGVGPVAQAAMGTSAEEAPAAKKRRADAGLPRRRSLLLSRAASARFVRVAAALPGGEEELAELVAPVIEQLFAGELCPVVDGNPVSRTLEDIALAALGAKMRGEGA